MPSAALHPHPCPNPKPNPHSIPISWRAGEIFSDELHFPSPVSSSDAMIRDDEVHAATQWAVCLHAALAALCVHHLFQSASSRLPTCAATCVGMNRH